ncbi:hypothetical protein GLW07_19130 [Bacillus hwajinpoensis]|uniref:Uncharacterized protein n=1 Tax=Guptibacillus hwajinpoensis TaxID=208199 RepID=A0A845F453_9BACL|nr:hypothetical protein [Pseudalkalibacillus hwajinpoensis]MYL65471.1 hypothetical protein [Pseudalkalibacillus hwajinpoensis]MYL65476.1 hypothetical protein [Pseudalkalibacillus hwajinpoensis]
MKIFEATYDGHRIHVENKWKGEKLYVDGELQDENIGLALRATLTGELKADNNEAKCIKVTLGGFLSIHCKIFVDYGLVRSYRIKKRI